ncbi:MAG: NAD(P)H-binding protein [Bacillota bacterium]|nr:NAD(P)H-binding protein [Bacillota bacterium]
MKILVFGATGPTGQQIVSQGLELGYKMTAFVRNSEKLAIRHPNLTIITGNVVDPKKVQDAVKGHDVIMSALGNGRSLKGDVFSIGSMNIVNAMEESLCKRIIIMSAFGVGNSINEVPILLKIIYKTLLKKTFVDKAIGERYLKQSNLDWTLVHPVILANGPKTTNYKTGKCIDIGEIPKISRADVADFMLKLVDDQTSLRRTHVISY